MTDKEYNKAKEECWKAVKKEFGLHYWGEPPLDIFSLTFDRAYALGREKEIISQDEIDKAAEDYVSFKKGGKCILSYIIERACRRAFKGGANFALGKQEKDAETAIQGWVCRDKRGNALHLHFKEPYRAQSGYDECDDPDWWENDYVSFLQLDKSLFPDLTWDDEPIEVEIIIKRKKK